MRGPLLAPPPPAGHHADAHSSPLRAPPPLSCSQPEDSKREPGRRLGGVNRGTSTRVASTWGASTSEASGPWPEEVHGFQAGQKPIETRGLST